MEARERIVSLIIIGKVVVVDDAVPTDAHKFRAKIGEHVKDDPERKVFIIWLAVCVYTVYAVVKFSNECEARAAFAQIGLRRRNGPSIFPSRKYYQKRFENL